MVREHTHCRVCGTGLGAPYLDLGFQPLANALLREPPATPLRAHGAIEFEAPLAVTLCPTCGLSQLTVVVDPKVLYSGYRFRSGASADWVQHCERLATKATEMFKKPGWVLDIAANDGTCLKPFYERGWNTVGVEPAEIPAPSVGRVVRSFWTQDVARMLRKEHGAFDLVIAQNVLGHVDDPVAFLTAVEHVLAPDGLCVIEVPHVRELIIGGAFDTIYHEHLSYWNTAALIRCARKARLSLHRGENLSAIHGGSRRYWLKRAAEPEESHPVLDLPVEPHPYRLFANDVERKLAHVQRELARFASEGRKVWAYGASAKGAVMLNALKARGNTNWPVAIVDDVKEKQGFLSPGTHLPIVDPEELKFSSICDVLWVLSWNWREQLEKRARDAGFRGQFFLTNPTVRMEQ